MSLQTTHRRITVVVIDDDKAHLDLMRHSLEAAAGNTSFTVDTHTDAHAALAALPAAGEVVIICDYMLAGGSGIDWLPDFIRADVGPVIIVTSSGDQEIAAEAFRQGASDYIDKSTVFESPDKLMDAITEGLRRFKLGHTKRDLARRLKLANGELQRKNQVLAELTDTAHRFVEDVAHEFRTPLAVIKEFASIMSDGIGGDVTDKQSEYLQFISDASRDLAHLIDDFLDSGKLRSRTLRIDRREHSVAELIESAWPMLESRACSKRVTLDRRIVADLPTVLADADKVRRSIINLVINAIKFSNRDDVVTVSAAATEDGAIEISVIDHGPGLPEEEAQQLFERFRQSGEANRISTKGFGLGLNIVRELVTLNLGTVSVASELGKGSTFSFTLPVCDVRDVVDAFVHRTSEQAPSAILAVLCVRRTSSQSPVDDLRSFVASACHATDLQLPGPDGQSIIVVGDTIEPECWRERLIRHDNDRRKHAPPDGVGPLRVEYIGSWHVREARNAILDIACPSRKATYCA